MEFDIGFLGGGQLARMSIMAAQRMGLRCLSLDPAVDSPAAELAPSITAALSDADAIAQELLRCRKVTLENEFIPAEAIRQALQLSGVTEERLVPSIESLTNIQDKLLQREALLAADVPSPLAVPLHDNPSHAIDAVGFPMVLKARFGGYDGKGTRHARDLAELEGHQPLWASGGWMAEPLVRFKRELACMVFIETGGRVGCFPTMETVQVNHVCDLVFPAGRDASKVAAAAAGAFGSPGLFGVEMFELEDGSVLINEIAPRPHNTGHYTLDWGGVSQFEQHVRVVCGLPTCEPRGIETCMANLMGQTEAGDHREGIRQALSVEPEARVHWYGKAESRPGRKMGHINVSGPNCRERCSQAREAFYSGWHAAAQAASSRAAAAR